MSSISPDDPSSRSTKSICEEILCLCDYSPPPLVSTLMTYRTPLTGLLTAAAVTYICVLGGAGVICYFLHLLFNYYLHAVNKINYVNIMYIIFVLNSEAQSLAKVPWPLPQTMITC